MTVAHAFPKPIPTLPLWLSPVQVRFLPVKDAFLSECVKLATIMQAADIRVDVEDRSMPLGRKIKTAEKEWIPYIVIFGEKESQAQNLSGRIRARGQEEKTFAS